MGGSHLGYLWLAVLFVPTHLVWLKVLHGGRVCISHPRWIPVQECLGGLAGDILWAGGSSLFCPFTRTDDLSVALCPAEIPLTTMKNGSQLCLLPQSGLSSWSLPQSVCRSGLQLLGLGLPVSFLTPHEVLRVTLKQAAGYCFFTEWGGWEDPSEMRAYCWPQEREW